MINNPKLIEEIKEQIKELSKEQLEQAIKEVDENEIEIINGKTIINIYESDIEND